MTGRPSPPGWERIGIGDRITTLRNDRDLDVANRDTWTVTAVGRRGGLLVTADAVIRVLPPGYVAEHVELAYAGTVHGVQGSTVSAAHLVVGDHTGAAAAYTGMTRGRAANTAHLVATDLAEAREQATASARCRTTSGAVRSARAAALPGAVSATSWDRCCRSRW